jgi:hypothetical protein
MLSTDVVGLRHAPTMELDDDADFGVSGHSSKSANGSEQQSNAFSRSGVLFKALELQAELQEALDVDAHRSSLAVTKGVAAAASTVFMATCLVANPATAAAASIATASAALVAGYRLVMARRLLVREKWILKSAAAQFSSSRFSSSLSSSQSGSQQLGFQLGSPRPSQGGGEAEEDCTQEEARWKRLPSEGAASASAFAEQTVVVTNTWTQTCAPAMQVNAWSQSEDTAGGQGQG